MEVLAASEPSQRKPAPGSPAAFGPRGGDSSTSGHFARTGPRLFVPKSIRPPPPAPTPVPHSLRPTGTISLGLSRTSKRHCLIPSTRFAFSTVCGRGVDQIDALSLNEIKASCPTPVPLKAIVTAGRGEYQTLKKAEKDDDSVDRRAGCLEVLAGGRVRRDPEKQEQSGAGGCGGKTPVLLPGTRKAQGPDPPEAQDIQTESGQKIEQLKRGPEAAGPWGKGVLHPSEGPPGFGEEGGLLFCFMLTKFHPEEHSWEKAFRAEEPFVPGTLMTTGHQAMAGSSAAPSCLFSVSVQAAELLACEQGQQGLTRDPGAVEQALQDKFPARGWSFGVSRNAAKLWARAEVSSCVLCSSHWGQRVIPSEEPV
ncbi:hypothetical protein MG293_017030 [Ovis ammon polii]|uniref:Uncharacterized protein n=1 Tax=Ovis ammon polii TaxID=230172 RepID=A0AAD4TQW9_OVIAM|nr:hypothetical protein MG293_017030 [Ovis ammon polii]